MHRAPVSPRPPETRAYSPPGSRRWRRPGPPPAPLVRGAKGRTPVRGGEPAARGAPRAPRLRRGIRRESRGKEAFSRRMNVGRSHRSPCNFVRGDRSNQHIECQPDDLRGGKMAQPQGRDAAGCGSSRGRASPGTAGDTLPPRRTASQPDFVRATGGQPRTVAQADDEFAVLVRFELHDEIKVHDGSAYVADCRRTTTRGQRRLRCQQRSTSPLASYRCSRSADSPPVLRRWLRERAKSRLVAQR